MSLSYLLSQSGASMEEIGAYLDGLTHGHRLHEVRLLGAKTQTLLYQRARANEPLTLDHFVPSHVPAGQEVIHHGKNSLPVLTTFQKRFCRPANRANQLYGYNEGITRPVVGPGFFVAHPTSDDPRWPERGAVVIDYFLIPDGPFPAGWPKLRPNSQGLQRVVYYQMRDFMRRVSKHVSVGKAYKDENPMSAYFVLCREDR